VQALLALAGEACTPTPTINNDIAKKNRKNTPTFIDQAQQLRCVLSSNLLLFSNGHLITRHFRIMPLLSKILAPQLPKLDATSWAKRAQFYRPLTQSVKIS
jgi:hypothetical protein